MSVPLWLVYLLFTKVNAEHLFTPRDVPDGESCDAPVWVYLGCENRRIDGQTFMGLVLRYPDGGPARWVRVNNEQPGSYSPDRAVVQALRGMPVRTMLRVHVSADDPVADSTDNIDPRTGARAPAVTSIRGAFAPAAGELEHD